MLQGACFRPQHCKQKICVLMLPVPDVDLVVRPASLAAAHQGCSPSDKSSERNWTRVRMMMRRKRERSLSVFIQILMFLPRVEQFQNVYIAHLGIVPRKWFFKKARKTLHEITVAYLTLLSYIFIFF